MESRDSLKVTVKAEQQTTAKNWAESGAWKKEDSNWKRGGADGSKTGTRALVGRQMDYTASVVTNVGSSVDGWDDGATPSSSSLPTRASPPKPTRTKPATPTPVPAPAQPETLRSLPEQDLSAFDVEDTCKAYVSAVHSPKRFFLQLESHEDAIGALADQLQQDYAATQL